LKVVIPRPSKLTKVFLVFICITACGFGCDVSIAAENFASTDMTIHHKPRRSTLSNFEATRRITTIIDAHPAIKSSIQDLVDRDLAGSVDDKTNRAIFAVYIKNAIFRNLVDAELDR
jgi:hypothetical protein